MLKIMVSSQILFNSRKRLFILTQTPNQVNPLWKKINMLVLHLSSFSKKTNHYQEMLLKPDQLYGEWEQGKDAILTSKGLSSFVIKGTLIPFKQPLRWA